MTQRPVHIERLLDIMARLRAPNGCPWDRQQTAKSLKTYLLEETYEVLDAIDSLDPDKWCDELGDLLFQVVFQAQIASEEGLFEMADVVEGISDKLERRHPHVFGDLSLDSPRAVSENWERLKSKEGRRLFSDIPRALPALVKALRVSHKAAQIGFDWPALQGVREKLSEELEELDRAIAEGDSGRIEHEIGDLLFTVVNLARKLDTDPEESLQQATKRFVSRFAYVEEQLHARGRLPQEASLEEMDRLWDEAKKRKR